MNKKQKTLLGLTPVLPLLLFAVLWPITIEVFGCGCVESKHDGNWVGSKIMFPITLAVSISVLIYSSRWISGVKRWLYLILGGVLQIFLSLIWGIMVAM